MSDDRGKPDPRHAVQPGPGRPDVPLVLLEAGRAVMREAVEYHDVAAAFADELADAVVLAVLPLLREWLLSGAMSEPDPDYAKYPTHDLRDVPLAVLEAGRAGLRDPARQGQFEPEFTEPLADSVVATVLPLAREWLRRGGT